MSGAVILIEWHGRFRQLQPLTSHTILSPHPLQWTLLLCEEAQTRLQRNEIPREERALDNSTAVSVRQPYTLWSQFSCQMIAAHG